MTRGTRRVRPTLEDLHDDGRALSPADLGAIIGLSRHHVTVLCNDGTLGAFRAGAHWKIPRANARAYCQKLKLFKSSSTT